MPYKRGKVWYAKVWNKKLGIFKKQSCGRDKSVASATEQKWIDEAYFYRAHPDAAPKAEPVKHLMRELITTWEKIHVNIRLKPKSAKTVKGHLKEYQKICGTLPVESINQEWVDNFIAECLDEKERSPTTVNRYLTTLASMLNTAQKYCWITTHPLLRWKRFKENERYRYFKPDEYNLVLLKAREHKDFPNKEKNISIIIIANFTGFRRSQIKRINVAQDVDFNRSRIWLGETKNDERSYHPLNATALYELAKYKGQGVVFNYWWDDFMEDVMQETKLNDKAKTSWEKVTFHTLRHTYGTWLHEYGKKDIYTIMKLMRLKSIKVAQRYIKVSDEFLQTENRSLDDVLLRSLQEQPTEVTT